MQDKINRLREARHKARQSTLKDRLTVLAAFDKGLQEFENELIQALTKDFAKPVFESRMTEIFPIREELKILRSLLPAWLEPSPVTGNLLFPGSSSYIRHEAKGVILIIAPWNYPVALALVPLLGALACGNTVLLKPSELTPEVSKTLRLFCEKYLPPDLVQVVEGGAAVAQALLQEPWDHIFFTGSTQVGRIVAKAAAEHLTPVTLELGGKSPAIIGESYSVDHAAERIIWGKHLNSGQTCVAPDYVLVPQSKKAELIASLERWKEKLQSQTEDQAMIISDKHLARLDALLTSSQVSSQTATAAPQTGRRRFPLRIVDSPDLHSPLMQEEIFGPILPIIGYSSVDQAIQLAQSHPTPLALYLFSNNRNEKERLLREIPSGGVAINDTIFHLANHHLPFGGLGMSGMGSYHGLASLKTFSHERAVFHQTPLRILARTIAPPYSQGKQKLLSWFMKIL